MTSYGELPSRHTTAQEWNAVVFVAGGRVYRSGAPETPHPQPLRASCAQSAQSARRCVRPSLAQVVTQRGAHRCCAQGGPACRDGQAGTRGLQFHTRSARAQESALQSLAELRRRQALGSGVMGTRPSSMGLAQRQRHLKLIAASLDSVASGTTRRGSRRRELAPGHGGRGSFRRHFYRAPTELPRKCAQGHCLSISLDALSR